MIVFLLIIIAIGVFLISDAGREILGGLATLGLIALVLVVGFWIIIFGYAFATTPTGRSTIGDIAELVGIGFLIYWSYLLWKNRKQIPGKIRHWWRENGKKQVKGGLIAGGIIGGMFLAVILWAMWLANH